MNRTFPIPAGALCLAAGCSSVHDFQGDWTATSFGGFEDSYDLDIPGVETYTDGTTGVTITSVYGVRLRLQPKGVGRFGNYYSTSADDGFYELETYMIPCTWSSDREFLLVESTSPEIPFEMSCTHFEPELRCTFRAPDQLASVVLEPLVDEGG